MNIAEKFVASKIEKAPLKYAERNKEMTENEKKVLANVEGMVRWLEDYQHETFGVSGDLAGKDCDLANYLFDFHREFNDFERGADESELLSEIKKSPIVFLGDFHNLRQSQKLAAELIKKTASQDQASKTLAVEFISPDEQGALDDYQSGKISEKLFLQKVRFKDWADFEHWEGYKKILAEAKKKSIQVFGIRTNQKGLDQAERDKLFAQDLKSIADIFPAEKLIVHIGDAHLTSSHLPAKMLELSGFKSQKMIRVIIQNIPQIYFSALRWYENFHLPKILKIKKGVYQIRPAPLLTQILSNIENLEYAVGEDRTGNIWAEGDLVLEIVRRWTALLELTFDPECLPEVMAGDFKEFRLKKILEELARTVFGLPSGGESFLYFYSKFFIPERRPENETERAGEKMFIDFLKGGKPVIPRI